ncbi:MAG: repressor LexA [Deltaproteobacteria bacterium]|nr:repressor LexA [Deltaproteobacteria bacterium]MBM4318209.1 repressor LexA [Deltaproteobacteria bacterium]
MVNRSTKNPQLTESQNAVLQFIREFVRSQGMAPSYRDIQTHFGYKAVGTVQDHVRALIEKGYLEKPNLKNQKRPARGLLPKGLSLNGVRKIPVYGEIAAGGPRAAEQLELGEVVITEDLVRGDCFALRVVGDSMIDVGIYEGDHVIVEQGSRVKEGDIVVALLDGETTVKKYSVRNGEVLLIPENKRMHPIPTQGKNLEIQGRVVSLQRKL